MPSIHAPDSKFYATAGRCTHEDVHLCGGLVMGHLIECPKHNGQFDYRTGEAKRAPVCVNLRAFPTMVESGAVFIDID
jgi:3-phenylpropionate/trans-cinnamate dioxygenase ferredoxin component